MSLSTPATIYAPAASVSSMNYTASGALSSQTYGNNLVHAVTYNSRLQTGEIKLGTGGNPTSVVSIAYNYGTNNNGNVQSITYSGGSLSYTQGFGYDSLNRLTTSNENSGANWSQTNAYDRYGNRWIDLGGGNQSLYFTASNNRITGSSYDAAGNLLNDGTHNYTYDAENKIAKVDNVNAYVYDGEGQRVRKLLGENLRFVYGTTSDLIMEFSGSTGWLTKEYIHGAGGLLATIEPTALNSNGTRYTTADHLSCPRVVTNSSAAVASRHDYKPFGEELGAGVGGRTTGMGFPGTSDGLRQKFTQKERDAESGLDYFEARYYSSSQGRFISIDPREINFEAGTEDFLAYLGNPQNWNRYAYVLNSPLVLLDQNGREPNKAQAGTAADVVAVILKIENDNPTATQTEILQRVDGYFQSKDDTKDANVRYVYTKENGWVDMKHFFAAAAEAATSTFGEVETLGKGLVIEVIQTIQGSDSAFSYEDLPSNAAGAEFGDEEFNPNSSEKLSSQVKTFLEKTLHATSPQFAPNYSALPSGPTSPQGSRSNQSARGRNDSASANNARNNRRGGTINPPRRRP